MRKMGSGVYKRERERENMFILQVHSVPGNEVGILIVQVCVYLDSVKNC